MEVEIHEFSLLDENNKGFIIGIKRVDSWDVFNDIYLAVRLFLCEDIVNYIICIHITNNTLTRWQ
jgi:hypothetical protein